MVAAVQTATANQCALASLDMARVRAYLGISSGGHLALIAMALLLGGDYLMRGAERIGPKQVQALAHIECACRRAICARAGCQFVGQDAYAIFLPAYLCSKVSKRRRAHQGGKIGYISCEKSGL